MRDENISIDSIENDAISESKVIYETSSVMSIYTKSGKILKKKKNAKEHNGRNSSTVTSTETKVSQKEVKTSSATSVDTNLSRKYPITLKQARNRVLKAIIKAKKHDLLIDEED